MTEELNSVNKNKIKVLWQVAIRQSNLKPTTKLVLYTISTYMNADGTRGYPSVQSLEKETGINKRAIYRHIQLAEKEGLIQVLKKHGFNNKYIPIIPTQSIKELTEIGGGSDSTVTSDSGFTSDSTVTGVVTPQSLPSDSPVTQHSTLHSSIHRKQQLTREEDKEINEVREWVDMIHDTLNNPNLITPSFIPEIKRWIGNGWNIAIVRDILTDKASKSDFMSVGSLKYFTPLIEQEYPLKIEKGKFESFAARKVITDSIDLRFEALLKNKDYRWQKILEELATMKSCGKAWCCDLLPGVEFLGLQNSRLELKCSEPFILQQLSMMVNINHIRNAARAAQMTCETVDLRS